MGAFFHAPVVVLLVTVFLHAGSTLAEAHRFHAQTVAVRAGRLADAREPKRVLARIRPEVEEVELVLLQPGRFSGWPLRVRLCQLRVPAKAAEGLCESRRGRPRRCPAGSFDVPRREGC